MSEFLPQNLPLKIDLEDKVVLKKVISAKSALAGLNGIAKIIPNQAILINSLVLQEAKDSSAIENIITTHDEIYKASVNETDISHSAKEVQSYRQALLVGYNLVLEHKLLLTRHILEIQKELEQNNAGVRKQSGTVLKNPVTNEIHHTPPQNYADILELLSNLDQYINDDSLEDYDVLVKMAIIHYQFETIHPFYDGNGRTGRIINILYLIQKELLDSPILYLSKYIVQNKSDYYKLLKNIQVNNDWKSFIIYMLDGVEKTSLETIELIKNMQQLMDITKLELEIKLPKIYSKDLLEIIFSYPYTKIEFLVDRLGIHRDTASRHLKSLGKIGILDEKRIGKHLFFINTRLFDLLKDGVNK
ncbi:Fic/DOC family N-terminal domain-containing protein [uncultured Sulfurimonas sp.]|jgi:Fic family protein|uniref:Fic family protein n=1 Tax=uncultured Sulfurimonas sp. TaxID=291845 RepID=UPI0032B2175B